MTTSKDLASIEKVDLREVWPNEAQDFTPWLAEHLSEFGDVLGLELELQQREAPVGGYSLDILAYDVENDKPVVIENQLGSTDHTHLGQLLTYAAGFDANVAIWIAKEFRDEHREALDLLNHRTGEDMQFFGLEVELWKIDDSRPAVNFKLVATPNEWHKQTVSNARAAVSERGERYQAFFQNLAETLREEHNITNVRTGNRHLSMRHQQGVNYAAAFGRGQKLRVEVHINNRDRGWNKNLFDKLLEYKESIESELGESLKWDRLDDKRRSRIFVEQDDLIDGDEETLEELQNRTVEKLLDFKRVFGPRLNELIR